MKVFEVWQKPSSNEFRNQVQDLVHIEWLFEDHVGRYVVKFSSNCFRFPAGNHDYRCIWVNLY